MGRGRICTKKRNWIVKSGTAIWRKRLRTGTGMVHGGARNRERLRVLDYPKGGGDGRIWLFFELGRGSCYISAPAQVLVPTVSKLLLPRD